MWSDHMDSSLTTAPPRAWRAVLEHVESDLLDGRLAPGDRLAPERELAASLGVGRSSVREALRVLEVMGLIRTSTGSGPSSGAIVIATPRGGLSALLRLQVAARGFPLADVVATRLVLEQAVVRALAAAASPDLSAATATLDAMDDTALPPAAFLALDAQFHLTLADASGNTVVAAMMAGLRTAIEGYVLQASQAIPDWGDTSRRLRREHRGLLEAIRQRNPDAAASLVHDHITGYYTEAGFARDVTN